ncbi:MAG: 6-hydroxymethylpterin diphosphokinase MptE-like protein [Acidobacteriota bacterium]
MKTPLPLLVTNGWDPPLRRLKATHPELEIITVTESVDLRSASEQIARALLSGRQVRQRLVEADDQWLQQAMQVGGSVFAQTVGTFRSKSDEWLDNILRGGRALLSRPSASRLAGCFPGTRAVVLGAGPSLDRVAPELPRLCSGAITIAAGSALLPLQRLGIAPNIACLIEGQDRSEQFASPVDLSTAVMVLAQHGHPAHWRAPAYTLIRADLSENAWFTRFAGRAATLASGGNVGAFAVLLAAHLGCREIVVAGLDFSQQADADHAQGATSPRFGEAAGESLEIEGFAGEPVRSSALLVSYRTNLEGIVNQLRARTRVINVAGRGAARISGTTEAEACDLPAATVTIDVPAEEAIAARVEDATLPIEGTLREGLDSIAREWRALSNLADRLRDEQAEASIWRARFGAWLARRPGSWGGVLLAGFVLDLNADPQTVVRERLAAGATWLRDYRAQLGFGPGN